MRALKSDSERRFRQGQFLCNEYASNITCGFPLSTWRLCTQGAKYTEQLHSPRYCFWENVLPGKSCACNRPTIRRSTTKPHTSRLREPPRQREQCLTFISSTIRRTCVTRSSRRCLHTAPTILWEWPVTLALGSLPVS